MSIFRDPIFYRGLERLSIVGGAIFLGYLGYELYIHGIESGNNTLSANIPSYLKVILSGTGPGLFFMAFGAIILLIAVLKGGGSIDDKPAPHDNQPDIKNRPDDTGSLPSKPPTYGIGGGGGSRSLKR